MTDAAFAAQLTELNRQLGDLNRTIGRLEGTVSGQKESLQALDASFDNHCIDDQIRHTENVTEMQATRGEVSKLRSAIEQLTKTLAGQASTLAGQATQIDGIRAMPTGKKAAAIAAAAMGFMTLIVSLVQASVGWLWSMVQSHWH